MNYYELTFTYTSPIETSIINDVLASELGEIGFESFTENENGLQGYISDQLYNVRGLQDKLAGFPRFIIRNRSWKARTGTKNGKRTISSRSASAKIASSGPPSTNTNRVIPTTSSSIRRWRSEPATMRRHS